MCFGRIDINHPFDGFLKSHATDNSQGNRRFVARNFLLNEGVVPARQQA